MIKLDLNIIQNEFGQNFMTAKAGNLAPVIIGHCAPFADGSIGLDTYATGGLQIHARERISDISAVDSVSLREELQGKLTIADLE